MESSHWDLGAWRDLIATIGVIASLLLAAYSSYKEEKARKVSNLIAITQLHSDLWREPERDSRLDRVTQKNVDLEKQPITAAEMQFVKRLVMHLSTVFRVKREGVLTPLNGLEKDVQDFFTLPIPKAVWEQLRAYQDYDLVRFIEQTVKGK
jgi:hypothetical protein